MFEYRFAEVNKFLEYLVNEEGFDAEFIRNNCVNDVGIGPIFINIKNEFGFNFAFEFGDSAVIRCRAVIAEDAKADDFTLLSCLNELSVKYGTHYFSVDSLGDVYVKFVALFTAANFVPEDLYGYYEGVNDFLLTDLPVIYKILGKELPKKLTEQVSQAEKDAAEGLGE